MYLRFCMDRCGDEEAYEMYVQQMKPLEQRILHKQMVNRMSSLKFAWTVVHYRYSWVWKYLG